MEIVIVVVLFLVLFIFTISIIGLWKIFSKANFPGWLSLLPFINLFILLKIVNRPIWLAILYIIPIVRIIPNILISYDLAKVFGKRADFAIGLFLLPFIFIPKLGFGNSTYLGDINSSRKYLKANKKFFIMFYVHVFLSIGTLILTFYLTMNYLHSYTLHDEKVIVPNFIGLHIDDVDEFIKKNGKELRYVIRDSVYSDEHPLGTVIKQDPIFYADSIPNYVKPNRRIYLTIVKRIGEYKVVPDLLSDNNSKAVGKAKLEMAGFKVELELFNHKDKDKVIDVKYKEKTIDKGTKLLKGSVITLVYGSGAAGEPVKLPNLKGMKVIEAKNQLGLVGLDYIVDYDSAMTALDSMNFVVFRQDPRPQSVQGGMVSSGSTVLIMAKKPIIDTISPSPIP